MPTFQSPVDSTTLFFRSYIPSTSSSPYNPSPDTPPSPRNQPLTLVFLHGWPMSSRMFDQLIVPLVETHRFPVVAPDRRGFGLSDWNTPSSNEITFDTFVSDLVSLLTQHLTLGEFVFVAASMGSIESVLAHAVSPTIRAHCRGFVWLGPNMPNNTTSQNTSAIWTALLNGFRSPNGKDFIAQQVPSIFRNDLQSPEDRVGERTLQFFERLVCQADPIALERTAILCQRPMEEELTRLRAFAAGNEGKLTKVMILHGGEDTGMPFELSAKVVHDLLPWSTLKVYERAGHGEFSVRQSG
ncbi:Alpha/Beta hydrolase protein [Apodospora peruviana]|uniref:Alpha/Beta hydrolase protein n=1 Tax=Apodospora peruviana TaxID=516989 RepID=A0AAE0ID45_9PEZI|nr:Alpha/Beta hydrolase protein [Apodospora peruviana]